MLLLPATLVAQAPDQAWRERVKALVQNGDVQAAFQFHYRANVTYGGKPKSKMDAERSGLVRVEGKVLSLGAFQEQPAREWSLPVELVAGAEDPLEPSDLNAWLQPHRLQALLNPASTLMKLADGAEFREVKAGVYDGQIVSVFLYRFKTPPPKTFDGRAHTRDATLQVWIDPSGTPRKAEIHTGYRGRFGRWHPFGRSTQVEWTFLLDGERLGTRSYGLSDGFLDDWTRTVTLLGVERK